MTTSEFKYVVLGGNTHFTYNPADKQVFCTHGGWGGELISYLNGRFAVEVGDALIPYETCDFTIHNSYDAANGAGLITR